MFSIASAWVIAHLHLEITLALTKKDYTHFILVLNMLYVFFISQIERLFAFNWATDFEMGRLRCSHTSKRLI